VFYPFSKGMALAAVYSAGNYYYVHRRAHLEPEWAKRTIPWHYDHHEFKSRCELVCNASMV
jgi:hypothetical protein